MKYLICILSLLFLSCKKDIKQDVELDLYTGTVWRYKLPIIQYYELSFTSKTECKEVQPKTFGGGFYIDYMNYTSKGIKATITNPVDGCASHKLEIGNGELILTHSNGATNIYKKQ